MSQALFDQSVLAVEDFLDNHFPKMAELALDILLDGLNSEELSALGLDKGSEGNSDRDREAIDFTWKGLAARAIEQGKAIPAKFSPNVKEALGLGPRSKNRSAGRPTKTSLDVFLAVQWALGSGVSATRNDTSEPYSACDAVAVVYRRRGMTPNSYSGIKAAWLKVSKSDSFLWTGNPKIKSP